MRTIAGALVEPDGDQISGVLRFTAEQNSVDVPATASGDITVTAGAYSGDIEDGIYTIHLIVGTKSVKLGYNVAVVTGDPVDVLTLIGLDSVPPTIAQTILAEMQVLADQAAADAIATAADAVATAADALATAADVVSTSADAVATAADAVATAADRVQTGLDATATAADRVQTGLDKTATAADRVQTGLDAVATAADRVQTGLDASAAAVSASNAAASYDSFDDRYLGSKAADPTLDNDGNALLDGALYWNTTVPEMRVYDLTNAVWIGTAYNPSNVSITGGVINGTPIGGITPEAGDFLTLSAKSSSNAATLGSDLVTNGTFTGGATGWTLGTGWSYGTDNVVADVPTVTGALSQSLSVVNGGNYLITFSVTCSVAGNAVVTVGLGAVTAANQNRIDVTAEHTISVMLTANTTGAVDLAFTVVTLGGTGTITIDAVSVQGVTGINAAAKLKNTAGTVVGESRATTASNTATGFQALYSNTTGGSNAANGYQALRSNTTGSNNTANGYQALYSNTTGARGTTNGYQALYSNTTGTNNTANGFYALRSNTTGSSNTANGYSALYSNTTGAANTASGIQALNSNTTGSSNTANGHQAGRYTVAGAVNETSTTSIYIGNDSRALASGDVNEIVIGSASRGAGSNTATIGNTSTVLQVLNGNTLRLTSSKTPASATDTGTTGDICWDANYIYICTATNTWKRTAIATW